MPEIELVEARADRAAETVPATRATSLTRIPHGWVWRSTWARTARHRWWAAQVGIGRQPIRAFTDEWIVSLTDLTPEVRKAAALIQTGQAAKVQRLSPPERVYPLPQTLERLLASAHCQWHALDSPRGSTSDFGRLAQ